MISRDKVQHIAHLAKLHLTDADLDHMEKEINDTIEMFEALQAVDTEGVEPTYYGNRKRNVMREDKPIDSGKKEALLANAPDAQDGYIRVPVILEKEDA